jgi:hypothetical protein
MILMPLLLHRAAAQFLSSLLTLLSLLLLLLPSCITSVPSHPQGLTQVELYPFPIPDVFVGQPLLVSGKFEGDWPETVEICGTLPDGNSE